MAGSRRRILVCDDDSAILRVVQVNLEFEGYEVIPASNGERAVELALQEVPDLVILDIMMPRIDGYETCQRLRANQRTAHIPVIFLSARAQQWDSDRGHEYADSEYLTKPFDPSVLLQVVERLLTGRA